MTPGVRTVGGEAPSRRAPRRLALALDLLGAELAPVTTLARVQACWADVAGDAVAAAARPTAEHGGVLTVTCEASVWAQELTLMAPVLTERLNEALAEPLIAEIRCRTG